MAPQLALRARHDIATNTSSADITSESASSPEHHTKSAAVIIWTIVGALLFIVAMCMVYRFVLRRKRQEQNDRQEDQGSVLSVADKEPVLPVAETAPVVEWDPQKDGARWSLVSWGSDAEKYVAEVQRAKVVIIGRAV